jgi:hypothetical protein
VVVVGCTVQPYHITVQCGDNTLQHTPLIRDVLQVSKKIKNKNVNEVVVVVVVEKVVKCESSNSRSSSSRRSSEVC